MKKTLSKIIVPIIATFFVAVVVYAGTTIGSNLSTSGNLTVTGTTGVTGATTLTGLLTFGSATGTSATATAYLMVGSDEGVTYINYNDDLYVGGDAEIDGGLWVGSATTTDSLTIGGYASTTGDLIVMGGTIDVATSEPTTTPGIFSRDRTTSTSTISIGDVGQDIVGCLEMVKSNGEYYYCYVGDSAALTCNVGRCN